MIFVVLTTAAIDFGLTYARRGELLDYIKRLGCFDDNCTRFYVAEVIEALEYLHSIGIIHRYYMFLFHCSLFIAVIIFSLISLNVLHYRNISVILQTLEI